jgi:hypothetical protein
LRYLQTLLLTTQGHGVKARGISWSRRFVLLRSLFQAADKIMTENRFTAAASGKRLERDREGSTSPSDRFSFG